MKIPITLKAAALALAGVALGMHPAKGALVYNQGDIFIGFRVANGTSDSYLIDIGSVTQLTAVAPGASISFGSISSIGQDLVNTYGAGWYDLSTLSWGLFGADGDNGNTLYASRARSNSTPNTPAALFPTLGSVARNSTYSNVTGVRNGFTNVSVTTESPNTADAGFQSATNLGSYYFAVTNGTSDFGSVSGWTSIEANNATGIDNTVLDLQQIGTGVGNPTATLGKFTIDNTGVITFTAVPEPSTYALLAISGIVCVIAFRRRPALQA